LVSDADPFLAPTPRTGGSQLSPTAATFTPGVQAPIVTAGKKAPGVQVNATIGHATGTYGPTPYGVRTLLQDSYPDESPYTHAYGQAGNNAVGAVGSHEYASYDVNEGMRLAMQNVNVTRQAATFGPLLDDVVIREGTFSNDDNATRAFLITNVDPYTPYTTIAGAFSVSLKALVHKLL